MENSRSSARNMGLNSPEQLELNVRAEINKSKSIVYPTLPYSVLSEFQQTRKQQQATNPFEDGSKDFGGSIQQTNAIQPGVAPQTRLAAPSFSNQAVENQRPKIATESGFNVQNNQNYSLILAKDDDPELVAIIEKLLRQRQQDRSIPPYTVGDLSAEIRNSTGKSWGGFWSNYYGELADFIRSRNDRFTLLRNKYVILAGFETEANIPSPEKAPPGIQMQKPVTTNPITSNARSSLPLNVLQQQQRMSSIPPMSQNFGGYQNQPPFGPFAYNSYSQSPFDDHPGSYNGGPREQAQNQINPFQTLGYQTLDNDPFFNTAPVMQTPAQWASVPYRNDIGNQMQQMSLGDDFFALQPTSSNPFGSSTGVSSSATDPFQEDDFWKVDEPSEAMNPLSGFETEQNLGPQADDDMRLKDERKAKKKQEAEDAAFARKLQDEEYEKVQRTTKGETSPSRALNESRITLSTKEIREMAESEIGRDNVRIMAGFSVVKYGREGRPHQRKMWINSSLTHLAWESGQYDGSHRGLELSKVVGIRVGEMTRTISRSTKDLKKVKSLCFSLETTERTLDLQACSIIQRDSLVAALRKIVEFNHKHKPMRIDKYRTEITVYTD